MGKTRMIADIFASICRNGARSWRPGMAQALATPARPRTRAAMEPGLGDREWVETSGATIEQARRPQWSPVLETGNGSAGTWYIAH